ncbi:glycosyltransferase family 39 protein [Thalassobaculum sp.]|uniref:ArnT family glycosyltransferase n=1 Tax=Thalassobaculum sp. TaxID=2022740 RepID=UPI0032EB5E08
MSSTTWMEGDGPAGMSWRAWTLVLVIAAAALFPGITAVPVMDRDEGRYLQATKQMMETGDYVDIRLQDTTRYGYPIGTYWAKAATANLFGGAEAPAWAYRLPSFLAGAIAVLGTAWLAARIGGPATGVGAGLLLAVSLVVAVESRTARSDALLLACVVVAQAALWRLARSTGDRTAFRGAPLVFWAAHAVGVLIKGPIITLVVALTVAAWCVWNRDRALLRRLHVVKGLAITALVVLPWLIAITLKTDNAYLEEAIGRSLMGKVATGDRAHGAPPGYHLVALFIAFWPGALLAGAAAAMAWARRQDPDIRFLVCWFVPTFLVFEAVATKLPHYTMPTYPALAVLAALVLTTGFRPGGRWNWGHRVVVGIFCVVTTVLALVPLAGTVHFGIPVTLEPVLATAAGATVLAAGLRLLRDSSAKRLRDLAIAVAVFYGLTFQGVFPSLDVIWPSRTLARTVDGLSGCASKPVAITGYAEPSVVFYLGTETGLGEPADAAELLKRNPDCGIAVTTAGDREAFLAAAVAVGANPRELVSFDAFNYTRGKPVTMTVYLAEGTKLRRR